MSSSANRTPHSASRMTQRSTINLRHCFTGQSYHIVPEVQIIQEPVLSKCLHHEAAAEFGFEPGAFRRHDLAGVGDGHELGDGGGEHAEGDGGVAAVHALFELGGAADAADEFDAFAGAG